jgi:hypothetical protein
MTATPACSSAPEPESESVGAALVHVLSHPWSVFVVNWNWKAGLLSAAIRSILFLGVVVVRGTDALGGAAIEIVFRILVGGCWGSLMQAFRRARPAWLGGLFVALVLPASAHVLEYAALKAGGATHIRSGMTVSIAFSLASLAVNYGLMRRGLLITGNEALSLGEDLRRVPKALGRMAGFRL